MSTIESEVLTAFLARIAVSDQVADSVVEGLREKLTKSKLPNAEELARLFASGSGDALA
jgi:hypothetical protein